VPSLQTTGPLPAEGEAAAAGAVAGAAAGAAAGALDELVEADLLMPP